MKSLSSNIMKGLYSLILTPSTLTVLFHFIVTKFHFSSGNFYLLFVIHLIQKFRSYCGVIARQNFTLLAKLLVILFSFNFVRLSPFILWSQL